MSKDCFSDLGPLVRAGRLSHAAAVLKSSIRASRAEVLLGLIDRGRYGVRLERSVLAAVQKAGPNEDLLLAWPDIFSALMCARKYHAAFRLGEAALDRLGFIQSPGLLRWPWWRRKGRALCEARFRVDELARVRAAGRKGGFPHWFAYYRAILLGDQGGKRAAAQYERVRLLDATRYAWMGQAFVAARLEMLDFGGAIEICRKVLKGAPYYWWVRCRMAEAYLINGKHDQGLRQFERAGGGADLDSRREILAWHGEALLWLGEYGQALVKLNAAAALGAKVFVYGWRGAARLKSGDAAGALADLDRAVALDPEDFEALCWRGETHRLLGRRAEAAEDLDEVIRRAPYDFWAYFNRALLSASSGDTRGLAIDFAAIPKETTGFIAGKLGLRGAKIFRPEEMIRILEAGLDWAKGVRRWEKYVQNIWMNSL